MTVILRCVAVVLCLVIDNEACSCFWEHPQRKCCRSDFVILAKVLSQEVKNDNRIFDLKILQTFKGASRFNRTEGNQVDSSGEDSLFTKAYTARTGGLCGVKLTIGTVYVLAGYIRQGKLQLDWCNLNEEWSQVTPSQRIGISRFYGQKCECQISPCYWEPCPKLEGCHGDWEQRLNSCCVKNTDGTTCSWKNCTSPTSEYENYTSPTSEYETNKSKAANMNIFVFLTVFTYASLSNTILYP